MKMRELLFGIGFALILVGVAILFSLLFGVGSWNHFIWAITAISGGGWLVLKNLPPIDGGRLE
ncbi:MAG TPA: hypothetical protein VJB99_00015 [Patescibacteria group bacterium]|nr:hypothetical protein [Patescibacteria group bacterium]